MIKEIDYAKCTGCSYPINEMLDTFIVDLDNWVLTGEAAPCQVACPAGVNVRACNFLVRQGRMKEAIRLLREALPLPAITGHVCIHPCETDCARKDVDSAVNINSLERYIADYELEERLQAFPKTKEDKVAVVGSGPAGLSAAYIMAQQGFPVTVFEAMPELGGMMRYGIPEYRLPRNVVDAQIDYIKAMGVEFKTGVAIGKDLKFDQLKNQGYEAVFIAIGAHRSLKLGVLGEDLAGVLQGLELLKNINTGKKIKLGKRILVIGGGNVAIDAARTAVRLGGEVNIIYRRSDQEMPAMSEEVKAAEDEGVKIEYLASPVEIAGASGKVTGVKCVRMKLGEPDASGRRRPTPIKGSEFTVSADTVVVAIGEVPDLSLWAEAGRFSVTSAGTLKADTGNLTTSMLGIFAGGDAVNGPSSVVKAIASGKKAAYYISRYLSGQDIVAHDEPVAKKTPGKPKPGVVTMDRNETPLMSAGERKKNFKEVRGIFSAETAVEESRRCMICKVRGECTEVCSMDVLRMDDFMGKPVIRYPEECMNCYSCELTCPMGAITVSPLKKEIPLQIEYAGGAKK